MKPNHIYNMDCVDGMARLAPESIPCVITSPPYDEIRNYEQLSFKKFQAVARQLYRILKPGGTICWVVQDQIYKDTGALSGTKYRHAIQFQEIGFTIFQELYLRTLGHRKRTNRYYNQIQLALCMSKGQPDYVHCIQDRQNKTEGQLARYFQREADGSIRRWKSKTKRTPKWGFRTNVWDYAPFPGNDRKYIPELSDFPALMQEEMADDLICAFSRPDWIVLDPFCGAATTCKMALLRGRRYLGFEIDPKWHALAERRMKLAHRLYLEKIDAEFSVSETPRFSKTCF